MPEMPQLPETPELTGSPPSPQDFALPRSIVTRLAKGVLPPNTQIQANAILAMTKSASVFISHLANAYVVPPSDSLRLPETRDMRRNDRWRLTN